jgi:hypothetical protein
MDSRNNPTPHPSTSATPSVMEKFMRLPTEHHLTCFFAAARTIRGKSTNDKPVRDYCSVLTCSWVFHCPITTGTSLFSPLITLKRTSAYVPPTIMISKIAKIAKFAVNTSASQSKSVVEM